MISNDLIRFIEKTRKKNQSAAEMCVIKLQLQSRDCVENAAWQQHDRGNYIGVTQTPPAPATKLRYDGDNLS